MSVRIIVDLWFPLFFQMAHQYRHPSFEQFLCWHYANAATIAASWTSTDNPFQEGM